MLDEQLRGRIQGLSDADEPALDEAARERILALIREEGPSIVRSAKRRRWVVGASGFVWAAAAVAALFVVRHHGELTAAKVQSGKGGATPVCASRSVPASARAGFVAGLNGADGTRLDLGGVALAAATPGTSVRLDEATPCRTIIALDSGTVAVHAKDLGGGELRVRTSRGDVVVHGTIFAVTRDEASLAVEVVVGNVSVTDRDDTHSVTTGQRLLLSAVGAAEGPLEAARASALRATLGVPDDSAAARETDGTPTARAAEPSAATARATAPVAAASRSSTAIARGDEAARSARPVPEVTLEPDDTAAPAPAPAKAASAAPAMPSDPLALAEQARRAGDYGQARDLYRRAAEGSGPTAEAAWVALARMELSLGHPAQALQATKQRQERFGRGTLGPEALWIDVRCYRQSGDLVKARELANQLLERWPSSAQARAADQWLSAH